MATTLYVDGEILIDRCKAMMDGHITYSLGAKCGLDADISKVTKIDCSGFTRYIFYQACNGGKINGGSAVHKEWMDAKGFAKVTYGDVGPVKDNMLRVGYYKKPPDLSAGHIWFLLNGMTLESYHGGDSHGPGRRLWDTQRLVDHVTHCYEIGYVKKYEDVPGGFGGIGQCRVVTMNVPDSFE
jgi:hypothetical protein